MSSNYWKNRMAKSQTNLSNRSIKEIEKKLRGYYGTAMKRTINDFERVYEKIMAKTADGKTPTVADLYKLDSYWEMQAQLRKELKKLGDRQIATLSSIFEINFFDVYYSIKLDGLEAFNTIDKEAAKQLINSIWCDDGLSWSQRVWNNTNLLMDTLNEELVACVVTGKKTTQLKNILQERFSVSYSRADALARTEIAHIQTQAADQRYKDYGVGEVEIWADKDERRCDVCGKLHKTRYKVGTRLPIPAHPNCRCCVIPVVD